MVNLSSKLTSMEILPDSRQIRSAVSSDKNRKRKHSQRVRFNVPDDVEEMQASGSKRRKKSPSPAREPTKKKVRARRKCLPRTIAKPGTCGIVPLKSLQSTTRSLKLPSSPSLLKAENKGPDAKATEETQSYVLDKNNNCSTSHCKETVKLTKAAGKKTAPRQRDTGHVSKHGNNLLTKKRKQNGKRIKASGLKKNVRKWTKGKRRPFKTAGRKCPQNQSKTAKKRNLQEYRKSKITSCRSRSCCRKGCITLRKAERQKLNQIQKRSKTRKSCSKVDLKISAKAIKKAKNVKSVTLKRKIIQKRQQKRKSDSRRCLEIKLRAAEKRREFEQELLEEIRLERLEFERLRKHKLKIIPIERNENYEVIPALRINFLKFITFKEAFEQNHECCEKCCWDKWSEVDAEDIEDDYN